MALRIHDRALATLYTDLESRSQKDPSVKVDDGNVLSLLATVADRSGLSGKSALTKLSAPGVTRAQQVALAQQGLSKGEKADLAAILDQGNVPIAASAREFLEAVIGRGPTPQQGVPLQLGGKLENGKLVGTTAAGATLELVNESTAPSAGIHFDDAMVAGKADASGKLGAALSASQFHEGDVVRARARLDNGDVSDWVTFKVTGTGQADTTNAQLALGRLSLKDAGGGKVSLESSDKTKPLSEPGAQLQITNVRTGEKSKVTLDATGNLPSGFSVAGAAGDSFSFSVSDGVNNTGFTTEAGRLTLGGKPPAIDLPDPKLHQDECNPDGSPKYAKVRFEGPLFKDGVSYSDVEQGHLGDCYFCTAMASLAETHPEAIQNAIHDNGDGTYTVTFKQRDWYGSGYKNETVKIDGDLFVKTSGAPIYARGAGDKSAQGMELWFPLMEKAYAQWKGSYDRIGRGGFSADVFEAVLGKDAGSISLRGQSADSVWTQVKLAVDQKRPAAAGTYGEDQDAMYTNTGVYSDHAYSVLGYKEENGERYVQLRNPWGYSEPAGNGPDDGVFYLKLADFMKLYSNFMYSRA